MKKKGPEKNPNQIHEKGHRKLRIVERWMGGKKKEGFMRKMRREKKDTITFGKNENLLCFDKRSLRLEVLRDKRVYCVMNFS